MDRVFQLFSSWHVIRWMGLLAFFFFTISLAFGMLGRFNRFRRHKGLFQLIHISSSWAGINACLVHMLILMIDRYQPYTFAAIFVPFVSDYMRAATSLGMISFYLLLVVLFTSDLLMSRLKRSVWKAVHLLVFPSWLLMLGHALWMGSDTSAWWGKTLYGTAVVVILTLFVFYLIDRQANHKRQLIVMEAQAPDDAGNALRRFLK
ncbi:hypothetical protein [Paenibacillus sp. FSL W8-0194]|uniref:hypothetical protein n=1 Tax=Paenibacillus sp. FSL W8-0194 TaxID=2921711 RepID=UPI0030DA6682